MNEEILLLKIEKYEKMRKDCLSDKEKIDKEIAALETEISKFRYEEDETVIREMLNSNVIQIQKNGQNSKDLNVQTSSKSLKDLNTTLQGVSDYIFNHSRLNDFMRSIEKDKKLLDKLQGNQFLNNAISAAKSVAEIENSQTIFKVTNKLNIDTETRLSSAKDNTVKKPSHIELTSNVSFKTDKTDEEPVDFQITKLPQIPSVQNIFKDDVNRELNFKTGNIDMVYSNNTLNAKEQDGLQEDMKKQTVEFPVVETNKLSVDNDVYSFSDNSLKFDNNQLEDDFEEIIKENSKNDSLNFEKQKIENEPINNVNEYSISDPNSIIYVDESVDKFCLNTQGYNYTKSTSFKDVFKDQFGTNKNPEQTSGTNFLKSRNYLNSANDKFKHNKNTKTRSNVKINYKTINKENAAAGHKIQDASQLFDLSLKKSEIMMPDKSYVAFYEKNKQVMNKFDVFFKKIETGKDKKSEEKPLKESIFDEEIMLSVDSKAIQEILTCNSPLKNERLSSLRYTNFN